MARRDLHNQLTATDQLENRRECNAMTINHIQLQRTRVMCHLKAENEIFFTHFTLNTEARLIVST